jgi:flagellar biosynthesis/type III secretory pathway chaperone
VCSSDLITWLRAQSPGGARQPLEIPAALAPRWQSIVTLARRAEALNQSNGQQIEALLERTRGALGVLQAAARPVYLYGADGHLLDGSRPGNTIDSV